MTPSTENVGTGPAKLVERLRHELEHVCAHWLWFVLLGVLLMVAGTAAVVVPTATIGTSFATAIFFGVLLMVGGVATIVSSFWIGKWSGFLIQLLVGILYLGCGFVMTERPGITVVALTLFVAVSFVVMGVFRTIAALVMRFPQWGWVLLNGVITMIVGVTIYRQLPFDAMWVIGLLVGLEMIFNGWTWLMLGLALRKIANAVA